VNNIEIGCEIQYNGVSLIIYSEKLVNYSNLYIYQIKTKMKEYEDYLKNLVDETIDAFPGSSSEFEVIEQYRNMKYILDDFPKVEANALEALRRLDVKPIQAAIRGGTDGSRLSYMGLPTPNLFAGGHNFHSILEWVSVQDMEMATRMIVTLCEVWEETSEVTA